MGGYKHFIPVYRWKNFVWGIKLVLVPRLKTANISLTDNSFSVDIKAHSNESRGQAK